MKYFFPLALLSCAVPGMLYGSDLTIDLSGKVTSEAFAFFNKVDGLREPSSSVQLEAKANLAFGAFGATNRVIIDGKYIAEDIETIRSGAYWNEFYWFAEFDKVDLTFGKIKESWGVMETRELVNVLNTSDVLAGYESYERLPQDLIKFGMNFGNSRLDLYVLGQPEPRQFFRVPTRFEPLTVVNRPQYSENAAKNKIDFAARYQYYSDTFEVAYSIFKGTNRFPQLRVTAEGYVPYYNEITQHGLEMVYINDLSLFKLEAVYIEGDGEDDDFVGASFGVEWTKNRINKKADLMLFGEYHWDEADVNSSMFSFDNHLTIGAQYFFNDSNLSSVRFGSTFFLSDVSKNYLKLEVDWGINQRTRLKLLGVYVSPNASADAFTAGGAFQAKPLSFVSLGLEYSF